VTRSWIELDRLAGELRDSLPLLVGLPEPNPSDEGRPLFNSAAFIRGGRIERTFRKTLLPTYDVFDEDRYFEPAHGAQLLAIGGCQVGISICEDIWNDRDFWRRRRYHTDPVEELVDAGARAIVNLSASPFSAGKHHLREQMIGSMARRHQVPIVYVNQYGGNDDLVFDGRSSAFGADGSVIARGRAFAADVVLCDLGRQEALPPSDEAAESEVWHALVLGTRDYAAQVRVRARRARPLRRHRLRADCRDCDGSPRRRERSGGPDAVAVFEPRQHRRLGDACTPPWYRNADAADR
jgi:NAD+ synthase/NAD+ synthase (glutamine-hydrolysing)